MAIELALDASVSLAWFLKETPERAAYAAAVSVAAAEGAILHVPVQWGIEMGHVLLREHRRKVLGRAKRYHLQGYDALYFDLARGLGIPLATLDHGHRQAAKVHRVELFSPE